MVIMPRDDLVYILDEEIEPCKCCLTCRRSMSTDGEGGSMRLVCPLKGFQEVEEYGSCDDYD